MLTVVIAVALFVQARRPGMPVYGATVVWAAIGVVLANWADTPLVAYTAAGGAVIVASSGNDGEANPGWPARYAVDPRFASGNC